MLFPLQSPVLFSLFYKVETPFLKAPLFEEMGTYFRGSDNSLYYTAVASDAG